MGYLSDCRSESHIFHYIKAYFDSILGKFRVNQKTVSPEQAGSSVAKHWRADDEDITKRSSSFAETRVYNRDLLLNVERWKIKTSPGETN